MPIGGEVVRNIPPRCPRGCRWGPPQGGVTLVTVGWQPCSCATALKAPSGHHAFDCCRPGCDGVLYEPPCSGHPRPRAIHT